jgi:hypothetical protein
MFLAELKEIRSPVSKSRLLIFLVPAVILDVGRNNRRALRRSVAILPKVAVNFAAQCYCALLI